MNYQIDAPILELDSYEDPLYIDKNSDLLHKQTLAQLARYFKMEMGTDYLQFDESMFNDDRYTGFLLLKMASDLVLNEHTHWPNRVIGGGVFCNQGSVYDLDWVWVHPFFRNKHELSSRWSVFKKRFGNFTVSQPISLHMKAFVEKHQPAPSSPTTTKQPT